jgi:hypothetical protein
LAVAEQLLVEVYQRVKVVVLSVDVVLFDVLILLVVGDGLLFDDGVGVRMVVVVFM